MKNARVRLGNGQVEVSEKESLGWFVPDPDARRAYIRLHSELQNELEIKAIHTILHELAHAVEFLEDDQHAQVRSDARSELAANAQVSAWTARNDSQTSREGYENARAVALQAHLDAGENLREWQRQEQREVDSPLVHQESDD